MIPKTLVTDGAKPTNHPANYIINNINRPTDVDIMTTFTTSTIIDIYITDNLRKSPIVSGEVVSHNWGSRISKLGKLSLIYCSQGRSQVQPLTDVTDTFNCLWRKYSMNRFRVSGRSRVSERPSSKILLPAVRRRQSRAVLESSENSPFFSLSFAAPKIELPKEARPFYINVTFNANVRQFLNGDLEVRLHAQS